MKRLGRRGWTRIGVLGFLSPLCGPREILICERNTLCFRVAKLRQFVWDWFCYAAFFSAVVRFCELHAWDNNVTRKLIFIGIRLNV